MNYLHKKHFTLIEAREILKTVAPMVQEILQMKLKLDERGYNIYRHQYFGGTGPNGEREYPVELERLVYLVRKLKNLGILIKDIENGLIDFPFLRSNKEEAYLCWKFGEDDIGFWHSIPDGFQGRRPIDEL